MSEDALNRIFDSIRHHDARGFKLLAQLVGPSVERLFLAAGFSASAAQAARDDFLPEMILAVLDQPVDPATFLPWLTERFERALPLFRRRYEANLLAEEVRNAASLQRVVLERSLVPAPGLQLAGRYRASNLVTGDLWSVLPESPPTWIALGDVAGHGLYTGMDANAVSLCIALTVDNARQSGPAEIMTSLNAHLCLHPIASRSVDLVLLRHDCSTHKILVTSAGTCAIRVRSRSGWEKLVLEGTPLGLLPDAMYVQHPLLLKPTDCVLLVSDGITDAMNAKGEYYGDGRLDSALAKCNGSTSDSVVQMVLEDVSWFAGESVPSDDQIALAITIAGD